MVYGYVADFDFSYLTRHDGTAGSNSRLQLSSYTFYVTLNSVHRIVDNDEPPYYIPYSSSNMSHLESQYSVRSRLKQGSEADFCPESLFQLKVRRRRRLCSPNLSTTLFLTCNHSSRPNPFNVKPKRQTRTNRQKRTRSNWYIPALFIAGSSNTRSTH